MADLPIFTRLRSPARVSPILSRLSPPVVAPQDNFQINRRRYQNIRHSEALERAAGNLDTAAGQLHRRRVSRPDGGRLLAALAALGEITGQTATEEIIERIFSRFCVGK